MTSVDPDSEASRAFGKSGQTSDATGSRGVAARLGAAKTHLAGKWVALLSEQTSDEQLDSEERNGGPQRSIYGRELRGWPFTPARRWRGPKSG